MLIRLKEVRGINEKYKISYGLQYDAWELIIRLPDWEEYDSEEEAKRISENRMVSALLTADAIFVFYGQELLKILPEQTEFYRFAFIREEAYERLGTPLSQDDMDSLIERDMLEEVIFSSRYILTDEDYTEFEGNLAEVYHELFENEAPVYQLPPRFQGESTEFGYLFESIWYQLDLVKGAGDGY